MGTADGAAAHGAGAGADDEEVIALLSDDDADVPIGRTVAAQPRVADADVELTIGALTDVEKAEKAEKAKKAKKAKRKAAAAAAPSVWADDFTKEERNEREAVVSEGITRFWSVMDMSDAEFVAGGFKALTLWQFFKIEQPRSRGSRKN